MIWVGVGGSRGLDAVQVAKEATQKSLSQLGKKKADFLLVFCSPRLDQRQILKEILSRTGDLPLAGASIAEGFIGLESQDLIVLSFVSDSFIVKVGVGRGLSQNARQAGQEAAWSANRQLTAKASLFIVFPDGLAGNGSDLLRGLQEVLGTGFPILGMAAADPCRFLKSYQYASDVVESDAVTGILFSGKLSFAVSSCQGWLRLGRSWEATKSHGNLLQELDGKPALVIYETYFGEQLIQQAQPFAKISSLYPLGVSVSSTEEPVIRYPLKTGLGGSLVCTADIPQNAEVHLMIGTKESFLESTRQAATQLFQTFPSKTPRILFLFESAPRARLLGRDYPEQLRLLERSCQGKVPWVSLHGFGELCPSGGDGRLGPSQYLNESLTLLALYD